MTLVLAIDQGTTNTKAVVVDVDGRVLAKAAVAMRVAYPHPGWAEQSADDIWMSVQAVIARVSAEVPDIGAIAISNQRESIVVWDAATGRPIAPCIVWQCRRSAARCAGVRNAGHEGIVVERTGLPLDPLFPAAKIGWILDEVAGARGLAAAGLLRAGTIDSWLLWNLTGGRTHATDYSNASRTQLFSIEALAWDPWLGEIFDVPLEIMPSVLPSDSHFGNIAEGTTALAAGTPIAAMLGDSHAALFGHGIRTAGGVKATYGTGSSLMTLTPKPIRSRNGLSGTVAWSTKAGGIAYALEGNIAVSGQAASFVAELLGVADVETLAGLAATVKNSNGVIFVPALVGLGAPHWKDRARGAITGLSLGTRPAHVARAALEAIAYQVGDVYRAMESDLGSPLGPLSVDGGASRNDLLMQLQADLLQRPVVRGDFAETSAFGAAQMTGLVSVRGSGDDYGTVFSPAPDSEIERGLPQWRSAVARLVTEP